METLGCPGPPPPAQRPGPCHFFCTVTRRAVAAQSSEQAFKPLFRGFGVLFLGGKQHQGCLIGISWWKRAPACGMEAVFAGGARTTGHPPSKQRTMEA